MCKGYMDDVLENIGASHIGRRGADDTRVGLPAGEDVTVAHHFCSKQVPQVRLLVKNGQATPRGGTGGPKKKKKRSETEVDGECSEGKERKEKAWPVWPGQELRVGAAPAVLRGRGPIAAKSTSLYPQVGFSEGASRSEHATFFRVE